MDCRRQDRVDTKDVHHHVHAHSLLQYIVVVALVIHHRSYSDRNPRKQFHSAALIIQKFWSYFEAHYFLKGHSMEKRNTSSF